MKKAISAVITLGGSKKLEDAIKLYDRDYAVYKSSLVELQDLHSRSTRYFEQISKSLSLTIDTVRRAETMLGLPRHLRRHSCLRLKTRRVGPVSELEQKLAPSLADSLATGSLSGAVAAGAVYSGVSAFGTASTGTAISALWGAAVPRATLAAIGGGSLATGGAGIAGGLWVLGGITVIPIIAFAALGSRAKAVEVENERQRIVAETTRISGRLPKARDTVEKLGKVCQKQLQAEKQLTIKVLEFQEQTHRFGLFSVFIRSITRPFRRGRYYTDQEGSKFAEMHFLLDKLYDRYEVKRFDT